MRSVALVIAIPLAAACARPEPVPASVEASATDVGTRITLVAHSGYRINARVTPTLELENGEHIALTSPDLTPDSSSFASRPWAETDMAPGNLRGILRASVCDVERDYCRAVVIRLSG